MRQDGQCVQMDNEHITSGVQRDTDTKVLHIHLFESAVYLFISSKQAWVSKASESHSGEPELLFFLEHIKTNVDIKRQ